MTPKDNVILQEALSFNYEHFPENIPEVIILCYARLLSTPMIKEIIADKHKNEKLVKDIESAQKWFDEKSMPISVVMKPRFPQMIREIDGDREFAKEFREFKKYLKTDKKRTPSSHSILQQAFKMTTTTFGVWYYYSVEKKEDTVEEVLKKSEVKESTKMSNTKKRSSTKTDSLDALSEKCKDMTAFLLKTIKGQDPAVRKFVQGYFQAERSRNNKGRVTPLATYFFCGPPGVGKTLLAKEAAKFLDLPIKFYNMTEFATEKSEIELIGSPPHFKDADYGRLTKFVYENPECILIFDEIEKAHIDTKRLFLQILGQGMLRDAFNEHEVDFSKTIIVFTSNLGKDLFENRNTNYTNMPENVLMDAISKELNEWRQPQLPPELCSRIASGTVIAFNHLSMHTMANMARKSFDEVAARIKNDNNITLSYEPELPLLFFFNRGNEIDARVAITQSEVFLNNEIYELTNQMQNSKKSIDELKTINVCIDWKGMDKELKPLFKNSEKEDVLVFAKNSKFFEKINSGNYRINVTSNFDKAKKILESDISAVFIDPFFGKSTDDEQILSISDYNTDGIRLFRDLAETQSGLPIYLLEISESFSQGDRMTLLQEGAMGTIEVSENKISDFRKTFTQIMDELYMERESQSFSQRGWVIDFSTRQSVTENDTAEIVCYNLRKRKAVDVDSRGSVLSDTERPTTRFDDVIGAENAKDELRYFVEYLTNPKKFLSSGKKPPKGVLLYGPPGTGKTMLARAMAGESDVTFIQTNAGSIFEGNTDLKKLFARARKYAPAIIFIDEIDAIGKQRTGKSTYSESILNSLLVELDGFSTNSRTRPVFVLAATNYGAGFESDGIASLDEALIRRFDNKIYVDLPNEDERKEYMTLTLAKNNITGVSDKTIKNIAERTPGQSLAIIQNIIELAIRNAARKDEQVTDKYLLSALEEYFYGEKKEYGPDYYKEVAIHEIGHAFISHLNGDKPSYITIESRGNFNGYSQSAYKEDETSYTRDKLLGMIRKSLAGRAAEKVFLGKEKSLNTGASSDLEKATNLAWRIICTYGMEDDQLIVLDKREILLSPLADKYVAKVNDILNTEMKNVTKQIEDNKDTIQHLADVLVKESHFTGDRFEELLEELHK